MIICDIKSLTYLPFWIVIKIKTQCWPLYWLGPCMPNSCLRKKSTKKRREIEFVHIWKKNNLPNILSRPAEKKYYKKKTLKKFQTILDENFAANCQSLLHIKKYLTLNYAINDVLLRLNDLDTIVCTNTCSKQHIYVLLLVNEYIKGEVT